MAIELKISEIIAKNRKARGLTQEELAEKLGVSAQAVSNWEHGGYPDITLLPNIANLFEITIDELMGNDELRREAEFKEFNEKEAALRAEPAARVAFIKEYYRKYPKEHWIADVLGQAIVLDKEHLSENMALLREACEKIIAESTAPWTRENAVAYMCVACPDDEFEKWHHMCALSYSSCGDEVLEDRLWFQGRTEEYLLRHSVNKFLSVCYFLSREDLVDEHKRFSSFPKRAAEWGMYRLRVMEAMLAVNGKIAPAWLGALSEFSLVTSWSLFACGEKEEGYKYLEKAFDFAEKWHEIPVGTLLDVGDPAAFGGVKIEKGDFWNMILPDGTKEWHPYGLMFMQDKGDLHLALTAAQGSGWYTGCEGFDAVRNEDRFKEFVALAEEMKNG